MLDVEAALATASQHQGHLDEHLATVVHRHSRARPRDARRQRIAQSQSVGEAAQGVQPDVGHHPAPTGFHHDGRVLLPFTLEVPSWFGLLWLRHQQFPLLGGHIRGRGLVSSNGGVKRLG